MPTSSNSLGASTIGICSQRQTLTPEIDRLHFNRYGAIGPCDGDLLSGRVLYDLKCRKDVEITSIWQLVGYGCLEAIGTRGERRMDAVGLINPRFGFVWQMDLDALCRAAGGQSFEAVVREFQRLLARDSVPGGGTVGAQLGSLGGSKARSK